MVITEHKRRANRENALKSTGPRTDEGKRIVSMNSLVHGARAEAHILPGDEPDEVRVFFDAYLGELSPVDGVQLSLATRMAGVAWKIERLSRAERAWILSEQLRKLKEEQREFGAISSNLNCKKNPPRAPWQPSNPEMILARSFNSTNETQTSLWDLQLKLERTLLSMYRLYRQLKKDGTTEESPTNLHESARMAEGDSSADFADFADYADEEKRGDLVKDNRVELEEPTSHSHALPPQPPPLSAKSAQSADHSATELIGDDSCGFVGEEFSAPSKANVKLEKMDVSRDINRSAMKRE